MAEELAFSLPMVFQHGMQVERLRQLLCNNPFYGRKPISIIHVDLDKMNVGVRMRDYGQAAAELELGEL